MNDLIKLASAAQAYASDPCASAFVSANAGTGKTKVLTDRVLRLLLAGAPADSILCVTYTRAAAAEMRNRIYRRLGEWTVISADSLAKDLVKTGIEMPGQAMMRRARSLFAEVLDNDIGPRVETVHSFCQSILQRFPIEAGVAPRAKIADENEQDQLKVQARNNIMSANDPGLADGIQLIAQTTDEDRANKILQAFLDHETRLTDPRVIDAVQAHFETELCVVDTDALVKKKLIAIESIDINSLRKVAAALQGSGVPTQIRRGVQMDVWLAQPSEERANKLTFLVDALFTGEGPRSARTLSNDVIREILPDAISIQQELINCLEPVLRDEKAQLCKQMTLALYHYGVAFWHEYERLKATKGLLDYNDLIERTNHLLAKSYSAQWVAWKLDNGIQHLLLDEAQDTSPEQWQLLRCLIDDFFSGEGADYSELEMKGKRTHTDRPERSVFIVGDFKQSIYSFQGADPSVMGKNRASLAKLAKQSEKEFRDVALSVSFRSSKPILQLINKLFPQREGIEDFAEHEVAREELDGFVEVWPVVSDVYESKPRQMFGVPVKGNVNTTETTAAQWLAEKLKLWIGHKTLSSGKVVGAGDILILLRKRGAFFEQIIKAFQHNGIPVAGADRMVLLDQIEIQDLLALGDVMMLPDDDLQLAALLKSPLCGFDDEDLYNLAHGRGHASLYARLMAHRGGNDRFGQLADQIAHWRSVADRESVFGFYSSVLVNEGRQNFIRRLGHSVNESLDHFLGLAQRMALGEGVSLLQFLAAIRGSGGDVKRDMDSAGSDEVRVMTIHGAKGLEAPIIVLPDMLRSRSVGTSIVTNTDNGTIYWTPPGKAFQPKFIQEAKTAKQELEQQEANRLLYVALTRACEGLVVAGWEKSGARMLEGSNYELVKSKLKELPDAVETNDGHISLYTAGSRKKGKIGSELATLPPRQPALPSDQDWIFKSAPFDSPSGRPLRPSQSSLDHAPTSVKFSPDGKPQTAELAYGRLAHRLFEILPSIKESRRYAVAQSILLQGNKLSESDKNELITNAINIMAMPKLAPLFSTHALAEVPINGRVNGIGVAGQIDRLFVGANGIILADFKTGQRPDGPAPQSYVEQLALYDALLSQIYPDQQIACWLIWTKSQFIENITLQKRQIALQQLFADR